MSKFDMLVEAMMQGYGHLSEVDGYQLDLGLGFAAAEFAFQVRDDLRKIANKVVNISKGAYPAEFGAVLGPAKWSERGIRVPAVKDAVALLRKHGFRMSRESKHPGEQYSASWVGRRGERALLYNDGKVWALTFRDMVHGRGAHS